MLKKFPSDKINVTKNNNDKRYIKNYRNATHSFAPRPLIFKLQQEL